ncbi:ComEA family DNA-binding protein [Lutibacter sp. B1]|uniref:ComEA family DNA-binding protein n=1 Tax=Lutibacter sp. B1 TaxID=2725996 RepID=UPI00145644EC|nr:helix-hairpin-helix domain-containing protein [Lutibacter sp. B1]NLP57550.1 hypothetical protein [Lutibacter sp. B1]
MNVFKSHFRYNKSQRSGILFLVIIIVSLQLFFFLSDFSSKETTTLTNSDFEAFNSEIDSLNSVELENTKLKIYSFNPNYITDFKGYQLGMSVEEIDRLHKFRKEGKFINSIKQFQDVTQVSDSLINNISPYFKFPDWVNLKKDNLKSKEQVYSKKVIAKQDINTATNQDFEKIKGVGEKLANRIVNYRTKLQGFSENNQIFEVWYLDKEVANRILEVYEVKNLPIIQKININQATFKQVLAIPYIDYELTKRIFNYKNEVIEIQTIEELKKIDGFPLEKFNRIALYLEAK